MRAHDLMRTLITTSRSADHNISIGTRSPFNYLLENFPALSDCDVSPIKRSGEQDSAWSSPNVERLLASISTEHKLETPSTMNPAPFDPFPQIGITRVHEESNESPMSRWKNFRNGENKAVVEEALGGCPVGKGSGHPKQKQQKKKKWQPFQL